MDPISIGALVLDGIKTVAGLFGADTTSESTKVQLAQIQATMTTQIMNAAAAQAAVNQAEASAPGRRIPTWRECIGYTCAFAFGGFILGQMFPAYFHSVDITVIMPLMLGMLGLTGLDYSKHYVDSKYNSPQGQSPD